MAQHPHTRTIFIGDVHGMLDELDALLAEIALRAGDTLIFLGDLVDKGPDQVGVIRRVGELQARRDIHTLTLRGNHEDHHIRYRARLSDNPGVARLMAERSPTLSRFHEAATDADWHVLYSGLPFWRCHERNILAVHGGIPGDMREFPRHWEDVPDMDRRDQRRLEKTWRTRFLDQKTGAFVANDRIKPGDPFWASLYDGRFGHVIFGHQPFLEGIGRFPNATGIDTGAVHGGRLTALILTPNHDPHIVSVPGRAFATRLVTND